MSNSKYYDKTVSLQNGNIILQSWLGYLSEFCPKSYSFIKTIQEDTSVLNVLMLPNNNIVSVSRKEYKT
jgi:hypothetical protein